MPDEPLDPRPSDRLGLRERMLLADIGEVEVEAELRRLRDQMGGRRRAVRLARAAAVVLLMAAAGVVAVRDGDDVVISSGTGTSVTGATAPGTGAPRDAPASRAHPVDPGSGPMRAAFGSVWIGAPDGDRGYPSVRRIHQDEPAASPADVRIAVDHTVVAITSDDDAVYVATWDEAVRVGSLVRLDPHDDSTRILSPLNARVQDVAVAGGSLWHTGIVDGAGQQRLVRTRLGDVPAGEDRSVLVMAMTSARFAVPDPSVLWALHTDEHLIERVTVLDPTGDFTPSSRVRGEFEVNGHPRAMTAGPSGFVWLGDQAAGFVALLHLSTPSTTSSSMTSPPLRAAPIDVADASNPLASRAFALVQPWGSTGPAKVVLIGTDDVLRSTSTDLPAEGLQLVAPIEPSEIELEGSTLWVLDATHGSVWGVDVSSFLR